MPINCRCQVPIETTNTSIVIVGKEQQCCSRFSFKFVDRTSNRHCWHVTCHHCSSSRRRSNSTGRMASLSHTLRSKRCRVRTANCESSLDRTRNINMSIVVHVHSTDIWLSCDSTRSIWTAALPCADTICALQWTIDRCSTCHRRFYIYVCRFSSTIKKNEHQANSTTLVLVVVDRIQCDMTFFQVTLNIER
jgi:hypothetical protein